MLGKRGLEVTDYVVIQEVARKLGLKAQREPFDGIEVEN